jgi:LuxR family maltose regulon positive regulatory protein
MTNKRPGEPRHWLAETKFHPPLLRKDLISRQNLLDNLHTNLASHPLTLLSAPAGYGKTTLLSALAQTQPGFPTAWLSLDPEDNDPIRFLTALIFALQHLDPNCGAAAQSLLMNPIHTGTEVRRVASVLINEVLEAFADPFALILDDLHHISEPSIFVALDYLLEHYPPQMHLAAATRVDPPLPLARLRARGELAELRLDKLRFSGEETNAFLNDRLHLELSSEDLSLLQSRAEGWAVGLRLLASSLERLKSPEERRVFIHHLAQIDLNIFDFLAEEVFDRQAVEVKSFLLETSILPALTSRLCQAVTRRADAGLMLEALYHNNLFLVEVPPLDGRVGSSRRVSHLDNPQSGKIESSPERQYRYHDLFAEFLHRKLETQWPERLPELHLRAAQAESDPARAVGHYLAATRWPEAAEIIERIGAEMFNRGYLDSLSRWINALPGPVRESHPRLLHYLSNCAFWKGSWGEVQSLLERALQGFEAAGDETGQGEVLADLATCFVGQGDIEASIALHSRALSFPIPLHTRVQSLLGRALAHGALGHWQQTERDFKAAMELIGQSSELNPLHLVTFPFFHPELAFLPGGLEDLERICRQARAQVGEEISPARLMVEEMSTVLLLYRGQLEQAVRTGEGALALRKRLGGHPYLSLNAALFLMIAHAARGDYVAVEPLFEDLLLGVDQTGNPPLDLPITLFYAARVRWLQGRIKEARRYFDRICVLIDQGTLGEALEIRICRVWMECLLDIAEGRFRQAERALRQPEILEQKDRGSTVHGCTRLMLARLYLQQNRKQQALAELGPVLAYHERLGIPYTILLEGQSIVPLLRLAAEQGLHEKYALHLLDILGADGEPHPVYVSDTGATLTSREVEVLRQIVQGVSNRTIAERLFISESTVKTHVYHIFAKMDVSSRTEAAARTRELGLLHSRN